MLYDPLIEGLPEALTIQIPIFFSSLCRSFGEAEKRRGAPPRRIPASRYAPLAAALVREKPSGNDLQFAYIATEIGSFPSENGDFP